MSIRLISLTFFIFFLGGGGWVGIGKGGRMHTGNVGKVADRIPLARLEKALVPGYRTTFFACLSYLVAWH